MASRDAGVRIPELRALRRDLKRLSPAVDKEFAREIRKPAQKIAVSARANVPKRSGAYARSIKVYAAKGGVAVGSNLPQAGVLHWGGTIRPRGVPITFVPDFSVIEAAERHEGDLVDAVGDALDSAAKKVGWR